MASEVPEKKLETSWQSEKELEYLWQSSLHEDELFSQRTNFLVLTQTVLLFAFGAIVGSAVALKSEYAVTLSILGMITSFLWIYSAYKADKYTIQPIRQIIVKNPEFANYGRIVQERAKHRRFRSNLVFGIFFPFLFISAWLTLTVITLIA
jgi:hypothetical protein